MKTPLLILLVAVTIAILTWIIWRQRNGHKLQAGANTVPMDVIEPHQPSRLNYEDSCRALKRIGHLEIGAIPPCPDHRPRFDDDEPLGLSFFRTSLSDGDMENLTLPRTYISKSEIGQFRSGIQTCQSQRYAGTISTRLILPTPIFRNVISVLLNSWK